MSNAALHVIVGSTNPVKIEAAHLGFAAAFPGASVHAEGAAAESGVSAQPMGHDETRAGARNRALAVRRDYAKHYAVGIEGGLSVLSDGPLWAFAWVMVISPDGRQGEASSGGFILPREVSALIHAGLELGEADDRVFGRSGSKQQGGSVGLLTHGALNRTHLYSPAVTMALIPFLNPTLSFGGMDDAP